MTELSEEAGTMLAASCSLRAMPEYRGIDEQVERSLIPLKLLSAGSLDAYIQSTGNIRLLDAKETIRNLYTTWIFS